MASKAELKGRVSLNTKGFDGNIRRMRRLARRFRRDMQNVGRFAAQGMAMTVAAVGGASYAIGRLVSSTAKAGDQFDKMSLRTGISAQVLSEYAYVAQITGTEVTTFQKALKSMARFVSYAKDGIKTYTRELEKMGVSTKELENLTPEQGLDLFIRKLREMKDPLQQSATAQVVFGRAGQELLPLIKAEGKTIAGLRKEAQELGVAFDKDGADKSARLTDSLTRLKSSMAGVRNQTVLTFIDDLSAAMDRLTGSIVQLRKDGSFVDWAADVARAFVRTQNQVRQFANVMQSAFSGLEVLAEIPGLIATEFSAEFDMLKALGELAFKGLANAMATAIEWGVNASIKGINLLIKAMQKLPGMKNLIPEIGEISLGRLDTREAQGELANARERARLAQEAMAGILDKVSGAMAPDLAENEKIREQEESALKAITSWQERAKEAERKKNEAAKESLGTMQEQNSELRKMMQLPIWGVSRLQSVFKLRGDAPNANIPGRSSGAKDKIAQQQLKVQEQIAVNTARQQPQLAW